MHCSTVEEAAGILRAKLTDPNFVPLARTEPTPAPETTDTEAGTEVVDAEHSAI